MIEAIAFISGIIAMAVVWFIDDLSSDSPYRRGYMDGYKDAMEEYKKKEEAE